MDDGEEESNRGHSGGGGGSRGIAVTSLLSHINLLYFGVVLKASLSVHGLVSAMEARPPIVLVLVLMLVARP